MSMDRHREIGYHDLERLEDEQALHARGGMGTDRQSGGERETRRSSTRASGAVRRAWTPSLPLTEREWGERWPIG